VLLVDDNDDSLVAVSAWLTADPRFQVAGTAKSGSEALEQIERLAPDLVVMDVTMSGMDGFDATRRIKARPDSPPVVLMSFLDSEAARNEAWAAGADEFITKRDVPRHLTSLLTGLLLERSGRGSDGANRSGGSKKTTRDKRDEPPGDP